jgi:3-hydroxyisobutyrate dehydrogenase-like beta-hydroxyacid dehydrogenase
MDRRVGLIGVGSMGAGVAGNLVAAGFSLGVYDRDRRRRHAAASRGAIPFNSPLDLARWTDLLLLSLPGPTEVAEVVLGTEGLAFALPPGSLVVNLSTISPGLARRLSEVASARRVDVLDAPVSGARDGAMEGRLTIMVGGEMDVLDRARPVLDPLGTVVHTGPVGTGSATKLLTNMLWFIHVVALAEALALGVHEGLGPGLLGEVVRASAGGSWVAEHDLQNILQNDTDRSFTLALCCKDLHLLHGMASDHGIQISSLATAAARFAEARERFGDSEGELAVTRLVEESAAVSIRDVTAIAEHKEDIP